jgi:hypothetical protein
MCNWKRSNKDAKRHGRTRSRRNQNRETRIVVIVSSKGKLLTIVPGPKAIGTRNGPRDFRPGNGALNEQQLRSVARGLLHIQRCGRRCDQAICHSTRRLLHRVTRHRRRQEEDGHDPRCCRACGIWNQIQSTASELASELAMIVQRKTVLRKTRTKRR